MDDRFIVMPSEYEIKKMLVEDQKETDFLEGMWKKTHGSEKLQMIFTLQEKVERLELEVDRLKKLQEIGYYTKGRS